MKYKECSVCLDKFKIKNMTETSCHHYFCNDCFFGILHFNKKKCPLCRTEQTDWEISNITIDSIEFE